MNHRSHTRPAPCLPTLLGLAPAQRWREVDASHCPPSKMQMPQLGVQGMHVVAPDALLSSPRATVTPCPFHTEHFGAPAVCSAISPVCLFPKHVRMYSMYHPSSDAPPRSRGCRLEEGRPPHSSNQGRMQGEEREKDQVPFGSVGGQTSETL